MITDENSTTGNWSASVAQIERGETRHITGEELSPPVLAALNVGEDGHAGQLCVSPIDGAVAVGAGTYKDAVKTNTARVRDFRSTNRQRKLPLTAGEIRLLEDHLPNQRKTAVSDDDRLRVVSVDMIDSDKVIYCTYSTETANEARARWQSQMTDTNSYHSAIPANPAHAAGVTAYDLSLGTPLPISDDDKVYLDYLCAVADWRTDWRKLNSGTKLSTAKKILEIRKEEKTQGALDLLDATINYYRKGLLPEDIEKDAVATLPLPSLIADQTVGDRGLGRKLD